jgi:hypothetical protein
MAGEAPSVFQVACGRAASAPEMLTFAKFTARKRYRGGAVYRIEGQVPVGLEHYPAHLFHRTFQGVFSGRLAINQTEIMRVEQFDEGDQLEGEPLEMVDFVGFSRQAVRGMRLAETVEKGFRRFVEQQLQIELPELLPKECDPGTMSRIFESTQAILTALGINADYEETIFADYFANYYPFPPLTLSFANVFRMAFNLSRAGILAKLMVQAERELPSAKGRRLRQHFEENLGKRLDCQQYDFLRRGARELERLDREITQALIRALAYHRVGKSKLKPPSNDWRSLQMFVRGAAYCDASLRLLGAAARWPGRGGVALRQAVDFNAYRLELLAIKRILTINDQWPFVEPEEFVERRTADIVAYQGSRVIDAYGLVSPTAVTTDALLALPVPFDVFSAIDACFIATNGQAD